MKYNINVVKCEFIWTLSVLDGEQNWVHIYEKKRPMRDTYVKFEITGVVWCDYYSLLW